MTERYVLTQPKPARRGRKPRKPLPRVHADGKRSRVPEALQRYRALEKEADRLWSFIVMARSVNCAFFGCYRASAQPHHLVSRRYRATRWVTRNGAPLCAGHHLLVGQDGDENRCLAEELIGDIAWRGLNIAKRLGKVDPALAIVALKQEIRERGLEAQARERGLL